MDQSQDAVNKEVILDVMRKYSKSSLAIDALSKTLPFSKETNSKMAKQIIFGVINDEKYSDEIKFNDDMDDTDHINEILSSLTQTEISELKTSLIEKKLPSKSSDRIYFLF